MEGKRLPCDFLINRIQIEACLEKASSLIKEQIDGFRH
jgi:hypothetical protein